jgi:hypothetical protein
VSASAPARIGRRRASIQRAHRDAYAEMALEEPALAMEACIPKSGWPALQRRGVGHDPLSSGANVRRIVCNRPALLALLFATALPEEGPAQEPSPAAVPALQETKIDVHAFRVVESYSGGVSYYKIVQDPELPFIRAIYRPPLETVTLGVEVPEALRQRVKKVRWKWRAQVLPKDGDECRGGAFSDSAAVVYISWKRGLKWYSIKYVWSSVGPKGKICDERRNLFVVQDTVILESGGPLGQWKDEEIDPSAEFRGHFEEGNPKADVPDFVGIGLMSDGDHPNSISSSDYAGFVLVH